ncbi:MAG: hypothetical protein DMG91_06815 [Acidobacteria bacterium]|jgi:CHAD domain-containing protein|nr:MAG: hypothetical protein DMG91_06815 [Acidobacteriota bacterium]
MPATPLQIRELFSKLERRLASFARNPTPQNVHGFRTSSRRVEALIRELAPKRTSNDKKLMKRLSRLRKKAGMVRDIDAQLAALRSLTFPQEARRKARLVHALSESRVRSQKRLQKDLDKKLITETRRRARRAAKQFELAPDAVLATIAKRIMNALGDSDPHDEKSLHHYRIAGKRARYVAELAIGEPEAKLLLEQLKQMQDRIGDWHDWLQLTARAQKLLGGPSDSALVAALRNITRAKYRLAVEGIKLARPGWSDRKKPESGRSFSGAAAAA